MFHIVPVRLYSVAAERSMDTYALIDPGSAVTTIHPDVIKTLAINGNPRPLVVQWTDKTQRTITDSVTVKLLIGVRQKDQHKFQIEARTMPTHLPTQTLTIDELRQKY